MPDPQHAFGRFVDQSVIITGAGAQGGMGTGKAMSLLFAREGARVVLIDKAADRAEETAQLIREDGGDALVLAGDVTDAASCAEMVARAAAWAGNIDVLVNNVGLGGTPAGGYGGFSLDAWRATMDINLTSAFLMTREAIPHLIRSRGRAIVNIASLSGLRALGRGAYGAAKAGLIHFTRDLAVSYGPDGLRANVIAPGHIMTPMAEQRITPEARDVRRRIAPLEIEGDAWNVAQAAMFQASSEARFITGVCLPVDGGASVIAPMTAHERVSSAKLDRLTPWQAVRMH